MSLSKYSIFISPDKKDEVTIEGETSKEYLYFDTNNSRYNLKPKIFTDPLSN